MKKKTKDEEKRNRNKLISQEEYINAKNTLSYYETEHQWITNTGTKEAIRQIDEEAMKIRAMFNGEKTNEQVHYLRYYYSLMIKKHWVESEQYAAVLMQNIRAKIAQIKQYEIDNLQFTRGDILKSFIGLDDKTKKARKTNKLLRNVALEGLPNEINLNLQSTEQILSNLKKHGNFVGIIIPEQTNEPTALVISNETPTKHQLEFDEMIKEEMQKKAYNPEYQVVGNNNENIQKDDISYETKEKTENQILSGNTEIFVWENHKGTQRKNNIQKEHSDKAEKDNNKGEISK